MLKNIFELFVEKFEFFKTLFFQHILISYSVIIFATIIGVALGILIEKYRAFSKLIINIINFLYTIPSIALLGFLIPFSGIGNITAMIALTIYALLPIVLNTYTGLANVSDEIIDAAVGMGSTDMQLLCKIKIPLALPVIFSAIRNALVMTIALTGIASFVGAGGLGVAIFRGITTSNYPMTIIASVLIAFLSIGSDLALATLSKTICFTRNCLKKYTIGLLLLLVTIFAFYFKENDKIALNLATKPMTEQFILGEMIKKLVEDDSDLHINLISGVGGGTSNIQIGMENGSFDLYPEYTGTTWNQVLKEKSVYKETEFDKMNALYDERYKMKYVTLLGFNNTYGLAVNKNVAQKYNLKTFSDLAKYSPNLILGAEYDFFEREDGYNALQKIYGFNFKKVLDMDISLKYNALEENKVDAIVIFTTDAKLAPDNLVVLKDDLNFFPSYRAGIVIRDEIINKYPAFINIIKKLNNSISDSEMAKMNYQVEVEKMDIKDVAIKFLKEKGLIK